MIGNIHVDLEILVWAAKVPLKYHCITTIKVTEYN